jgi:hypothetical protein
VIEINGKSLTAWLYRGGHPDTFLELVSTVKLSEHLGVRHGDALSIVIEQSPEGSADMPTPPPDNDLRKI